MKYVIFGSAPTYHITTLDNYNARCMDANKVTNICDCASYEEAYQAAMFNGWKPGEIVKL